MRTCIHLSGLRKLFSVLLQGAAVPHVGASFYSCLPALDRALSVDFVLLSL